MSWLFSQALVEEYLGASCLDGEPSAPSNGNPTQLAYLPPDKMTDFSRLSRFGMTFKLLTADRGEELLTLFRAVFPAKTLVPQEREPESKANDQECGNTWRGSFAKFDPDSFSWKTAQCSLLGDLEPYSETWPKWGSMRNGECWEQPTLVPHTNVTESGSSQQMWPTPCASDHRDRGHLGNPAIQRRLAIGKQLGLSMVVDQASGQLNPTWVEWLMGWPPGWTDLKPLEMDKSPSAPQPLGDC